MESPGNLDPTEGKNGIRHANGTDKPQHIAFYYSNFFTFFDDIPKQCHLEIEKTPFHITKLGLQTPNLF